MERGLVSARQIVRRKRISQLAAARGLSSKPSDRLSSAHHGRSISRAITARAITARGTTGRHAKSKFTGKRLPSLPVSPENTSPRMLSPYDVIPPLKRRPSTAGNTSSEINSAIEELRRKNVTLPILKNGEPHPYPYFIGEDSTLSDEEVRPRSAPTRHHNQWKDIKRAMEKFRMDNKFAKSFIKEYLEDGIVDQLIHEIAIGFSNDRTPTPYDIPLKKIQRSELTDEELVEYVTQDMFEDLLKISTRYTAWDYIRNLGNKMSEDEFRTIEHRIGNTLVIYEDHKAALLLHQLALEDSDTVRDGTHRILKDLSIQTVIYNWFKVKKMSKTMQNYSFKTIHNKVNNSTAVSSMESLYSKEMTRMLDSLDSKEIKATPPR